MAFTEVIKKHNLQYDITKEGYNWTTLVNMYKAKGLFTKEWQQCIINYMDQHYDASWKSFKELFDITI